MPQIEIHCPSGLKGVVRGLRGEELDVFANRQEVQRRRVSRTVLTNCWVETLELGPAYEGRLSAEKLHMDKVLMCDRFYALLQIRCATHGPQYDFRVQCSDPSCRKRYDWGLDINKDLPVYELPDPSIECFRAENRFTAEILNHEVTFKLQVGEDEDTTVSAVQLSPTQQATTALAQRVVSVLTPEGKLLDHKAEIRVWAKGLDVPDAMALIDEMDLVDGGVETSIEIQCPHCGHMEDISLPLEGEFWTPQRRRSTEGRKVRRPSRGS